MNTPAVLVLDGGLSNALAERGHDLSGDLWTARLLRDAPEEIAAVHRAYFAAGARVATTASYQASIDGFVRLGLSAGEASALITRSVTIARGVRDELAGDGVERLVAASVGPYGAVLADGSEYRGQYGLSAARAAGLPCASAGAARRRPARTCWLSRPFPISTRPRCSSLCWTSSGYRPG